VLYEDHVRDRARQGLATWPDQSARAAQSAGANRDRDRSRSGVLLGGALIVETIFAWRGWATLMIAAVGNADTWDRPGCCCVGRRFIVVT